MTLLQCHLTIAVSPGTLTPISFLPFTPWWLKSQGKSSLRSFHETPTKGFVGLGIFLCQGGNTKKPHFERVLGGHHSYSASRSLLWQLAYRKQQLTLTVKEVIHVFFFLYQKSSCFNNEGRVNFFLKLFPICDHKRSLESLQIPYVLHRYVPAPNPLSKVICTV